MYKKIISIGNLELAYIKIAADMELDGRSGRYCGWDSMKLADIEIRSLDVITEAREEMIALEKISPAVLFKIPKKSNPQKTREIYIYNLKERIKAQAIYQVLEPVFDQYFSPYLFSYRSSHSSYFAARSAVRHYKKYWDRDYVFIGDLADYSNYIQHEPLKEKINKLNLDKKIEELLFLFIDNEIVRDGQIIRPDEGLVQGVPLVALFNNLYLDDFDKYAGPRADLYKRVGDDLIIFDRNIKKLEPLQDRLLKEAKDLGLKVNLEKTKLQTADKEFTFLGYYFKEGKISLPSHFYEATIKKWKKDFSYHSFKHDFHKKKHLQKVLKRDRQNLREQFKQLAEQKKLVNDEKQIRQLSEAFFKILTRYFFKTYTPRNRRLLLVKLKNIGLLSLYKQFVKTRYGYSKRKN